MDNTTGTSIHQAMEESRRRYAEARRRSRQEYVLVPNALADLMPHTFAGDGAPTSDEAPLGALSNQDEQPMKTKDKTRHLTKAERDALHRPESDYTLSRGKEVCRSACTLEVTDIIIKYKKK